MGAVRKLATVVILGLVALSTLMVVYLATEPNRRGTETGEQEYTQVERGTQLYITYCLQCHGAQGLGSGGEETNAQGQRRVGGILNQDALMPEEAQANLNANYQSDDPVAQGVAEDFLRFRIMYGLPPEQFRQNFDEPVRMPAFRHDLNVEQINDLVYLIMYGDWNYVYNTVVHQTGQSVCAATPTLEMCADGGHDAYAYPTVPPAADAEGSPEASPQASPAATTDQGADTSGGEDHQIVSVDSAYDTDAITVRPGDTITLRNDGFLQHDIVVADLNLDSGLATNGQTVTITIPEDAAPGEYNFHCSVPGHEQLGMTGTLTVEAP